MMLRRLQRLMLAAAALVAASAASAQEPPGDPFPSRAVRIYKAVDVRTRITFGDLWLSDTNARFDLLRSRAQIRYTETLPPSDDAELSNARLYQILNFAQFFNANRHKAGFCTMPVKWIALRETGPRELRVTLIVSDVQGGAAKPTLCAAETYRLPQD